MAVLSKIRQRSILLIGIIGFCLLAFIIGDIINSGGFGITKNIGSVNGTDIPASDFKKELEGMQGGSTTQATNSIWNREVESILYGERVEKAGIRVGKDHVLDVYGQSYGQQPQFMNALGQFDKAKFNEFLVNLKKDNPALYQNFEASRPKVEAFAKKQVYVNMVKGGFFTTDIEGKQRYAQDNDKVNFDYVFVSYNTVNDDQAKVTDEELIAYMKENSKKYKAEPTRDVELVVIENKPSAADEAETKKEIESFMVASAKYSTATGKTDTIPGFASLPAADVAQFVNEKSEIPFDTTYVTKAQLPAEFAEQIYNTPVGQVFGPYKDGNTYKLTRMMSKKPGATVKAQHILIAYKGSKTPDPKVTITKEEAKAKADQLLAQVNANPSSFGQLVRENSNDQGSVANEGIYDNVTKGQMVPTFDAFIFDSPIGRTGVVETDFGYHVIKVLDKYEGVQVATLAIKLQPSEKTVTDNFNKATKLEMDARSGKKLEDLAKQAGLVVTPANGLHSYDEAVPGVGAQRAIVRWAYEKDTKIGDVKGFDVNGSRVIAKLKNINDNGLISLEEAKMSVLPIVRNQKKAEMIRKKMTGNTLEAVSKASGSGVNNAAGVTMGNPMVPSVGMEPKVVGKAFGLAAGKTSGLIDGEAGVFMVRSKSVEKAAALPNYSTLVKGITSQNRNMAESKLTKAMKDAADIEDNRFEFN
jgi:peptidyl-prolyl cis-trans isomerase D